jgi:hypothetical protein
MQTITKKLDIVQCTDREMVLYAAGRLVGPVGDWWDAYATAHPNKQNITWQEFRDNFRTYHTPSEVIMLKQREFLSLRQGSMYVTEYLDKFTHLSCYAPDEVNTDPKRQERFLDGLIGPLNYQMQSHTFPDFQTLVNKAIGLESKRKELGEQKCKFQSHGQFSLQFSAESVSVPSWWSRWEVLTEYAAAAFVSATTLQPTDIQSSYSSAESFQQWLWGTC